MTIIRKSFTVVFKSNQIEENYTLRKLQIVKVIYEFKIQIGILRIYLADSPFNEFRSHLTNVF